MVSLQALFTVAALCLDGISATKHCSCQVKGLHQTNFSNCRFFCVCVCFHTALCCQLTTVVMVVAVAVSSQATAATAPDSRCGIDNGLVADESSCRGFIICLKGLARPLQCSRDLLFNRDRLTCDFPSSVHCGNRPRDVGNGTRCLCVCVCVGGWVGGWVRVAE